MREAATSVYLEVLKKSGAEKSQNLQEGRRPGESYWRKRMVSSERCWGPGKHEPFRPKYPNKNTKRVAKSPKREQVSIGDNRIFLWVHGGGLQGEDSRNPGFRQGSIHWSDL